MRAAGIWVCNALAWVVLLTALPSIWVCGFFRGLAVALHPEPPERWHRQAVLTDQDVGTILKAHDRALARGEARWQ